MLKTFDKERLLLSVAILVCLTASITLEVWVRKCGFLLTPDSYEYVSAAATFKASRLFIGTSGNYYTQWPPLFPVILALFEDPLAAMVWIQVICKIVLAAVVLSLANHFLKNVVIKIIFFSGVWLSVHMLMISVFLWSEIIFVTLFMIHLFACVNLNKKDMYYYVMLAAGILLCLQRNAGIFLVFSATVWMLMDSALIVKRKIYKAVSYAGICTMTLLCWYYYNIFFMVGSEPFYKRDFFAHTSYNIEYILITLSHLFVPLKGKIAVATGIVISIVFIIGCYQHFNATGTVKLLVLTIAIYTIGFLAIPNLNVHEMERFFAAILPVFLILMMVFVERLIVIRSWWLTPGILFFSLWIAYSVVRTGKNALQWHEMSCKMVYAK